MARVRKVGKAFEMKHWHCCTGIGFALIILVIGLFWLGRDLGYINTNVSIWAVLFIVLGLYWLLKGVFRRGYY